ncbi:MAG TPA: Rpp14/Pop5 family protein [Candidatus Nanoarchaeia archaeon]|nr:Rpp14/Pop5 family protein [Candidatus Nanoarchaeia archaeon]
MKPLLPSLKEKRRYIAYEVLSQTQFSEKDVSDAIVHTILEQVGVQGLAHAGIRFLGSKHTRGIMRVNKDAADLVKSAFPFIRSIRNKSAIVHSIGMSGILAKAQKKYMGD